MEENDGGLLHLEGASAAFTRTQLSDLFAAPDWHPGAHPAMPPIVAHGRTPSVQACAYCHLPTGEGRPANASLAGLQVVETSTVPRPMETHWIMATDPAGGTEPLGMRIIEVPEDLGRFELRDDGARFVAYAPPKSIARGEVLVQRGGPGKTMPCAGCHGADLRGTATVPPLAGRSPSYLVRQLYDLLRLAKKPEAEVQSVAGCGVLRVRLVPVRVPDLRGERTHARAVAVPTVDGCGAGLLGRDLARYRSDVRLLAGAAWLGAVATALSASVASCGPTKGSAEVSVAPGSGDAGDADRGDLDGTARPGDASAAADGALLDGSAPCATRISYGAAWVKPQGHPNAFDDVAGLVTWDGACTNEGANSYATLSNGFKPYFSGHDACLLALDQSGAVRAPHPRLRVRRASPMAPRGSRRRIIRPRTTTCPGECSRMARVRTRG